MDKNKNTHSIEHGLQGAAFGITEAVIMMMGVLYALYVTGDRRIIILGILASGIADAFANSSAFHISEETEGIHTGKEIWKSTIWCFLGTAFPVILFIIPLFIFPIQTVIIFDGIMGLALLAAIGYYVGRMSKEHTPIRYIVEYLAIGVIVPIICYGAGKLVLSLI